MVVNQLNNVPMMVEVSLIPGKQLYFKTVSSWNCSASVKQSFIVTVLVVIMMMTMMMTMMTKMMMTMMMIITNMMVMMMVKNAKMHLLDRCVKRAVPVEAQNSKLGIIIFSNKW